MMLQLQAEVAKLLKLNPKIKNRILFLTYGGSYAYGTNVEGSDVDLRGIVLPCKEDVLLLHDFEEYRFMDKTTESDILLYSLHKAVRLLSGCNPNVIELLGGRPDFYVELSPAGKKLLYNKEVFLSREAANSFSGYARAQLIRLNNAIAKKTGNESLMEQAYASAISRTLSSATERFPSIKGSQVSVYCNHENEDLAKGTLTNINANGVPVKELYGMLSSISTTIDQFTKQGARNTKKDDAHLNKHAMHLVRFLLTGLDILRDGKIVAYREKEHGLLMDIRNGKFRLPDGTFSKEFSELVTQLSHDLNIAVVTSPLPVRPDMEKIKTLESEIMEEYLYANH